MAIYMKEPQGYHSQQSIHHAQVIPIIHPLRRQSSESGFTPLQRYLSRNPPPKDCYVWSKFATFWMLNNSSDNFNYLLHKLETVMLI